MAGGEPMKKTSQLGFSIIFVLLAAILMISVYTVVLQRSYGCIAEEAAVARDTKCADVIHQVVSDKFNRNDFQTITTKADMETARYQELQQELNELRRLNSTFLFNMSHDIRTPLNGKRHHGSAEDRQGPL